MPQGPELLYANDMSGTMIAAATSSVTLAAADNERNGLYIFNDSPNILFVKFGSGVTSQNFSLQIASYGIFQSTLPCPTSIVTGVWPSGASGSACVTTIS